MLATLSPVIHILWRGKPIKSFFPRSRLMLPRPSLSECQYQSTFFMPPVSEIDDIFASKGSAKAEGPSVVTSALSAPKKKSKSKKAKKSTSTEKEAIAASSSTSTSPTTSSSAKKRAAPETLEFVDPSAKIKQSKRAKVEKAASSKVATKSDSTTDGQDRFKDSRGSSSRAKTADGWSIYKEDELGLGSTTGGDTPLCPFDCECCF